MNDLPLWRTNPKRWVEQMLVSAQKARSNVKEALPYVDEDFLAHLQPFLFGEKCIVPILFKMTSRPHITPLDILNLTHILQAELTIGVPIAWLGVEVPTPEEVIDWMTEISLEVLKEE